MLTHIFAEVGRIDSISRQALVPRYPSHPWNKQTNDKNICPHQVFDIPVPLEFPTLIALIFAEVGRIDSISRQALVPRYPSHPWNKQTNDKNICPHQVFDIPVPLEFPTLIALIFAEVGRIDSISRQFNTKEMQPTNPISLLIAI